MKLLKDSFVYLHKALSSINEKNETELIKSPDSETVAKAGSRGSGFVAQLAALRAVSGIPANEWDCSTDEPAAVISGKLRDRHRSDR
jgi:hypothetical protein